ncbi:MAG: HAD family hydrolase [Bacteroidia bacterium]|jgi:D-glycero-D-manno-heptose 1,7-bisphosphate phosphatase|nr:HAD family hydrolase [Bacteroidia bacterium]
MKKLVLLDRDGVLNREIGDYITNKEEFELLPHVIPNLKRLKNAGCKFVIVTNQSGIHKRKYTHHDLNEIHEKLKEALAVEDIYFEEIYYCPHHPYYSQCICRKPKSGMVQKALARFEYKAEEAILIGDTPRDVEAAEGAGVRGFKINANYDWKWVIDQLEKERWLD